VTEDHREVGPLSRGVMLLVAQPLSERLPFGVRFLPNPVPPVLSGRLAASVPGRGELAQGGQGAYHVPQVESLGEGRSRFFAGGAASAWEEFGASQPDHVPFWSRRISILRLFVGDDVYQRFTMC
jgi:hypothetical protein